MKKLLTFCAFILAFGFAEAQTDTTRLEFDYYPETNIYYNVKAHSYWHFDSASKKWQSTLQLPSGYSISDKSKKNKLYADYPEIWQKNAAHIKMFGDKNKPAKPGQ